MLICQSLMLFTWDLIKDLKYTSFNVAAFTDSWAAESVALHHLPSFLALLCDNIQWQLQNYCVFCFWFGFFWVFLGFFAKYDGNISFSFLFRCLEDQKKWTERFFTAFDRGNVCTQSWNRWKKHLYERSLELTVWKSNITIIIMIVSNSNSSAVLIIIKKKKKKTPPSPHLFFPNSVLFP